LIVYAISTEQNIAKLFMAAFIPGLMASLFYILAIAWTVRRDPEAGPAGPRIVGPERRQAMIEVVPVLLIAFAVLGGIYGGVFTPTEGAAVGAIATLLVGLAYGRLGWAEIRGSLVQTAELTAMIFIILLGAEVFNAFLTLSDLQFVAAETIVDFGWPPYGVLVALLVFYIVLGGVMDELAMILLTLPIFFPIIMELDFGLDPEELAIWFGILVLVIVGVGLAAPPMGLNVFVMSAVAKEVPLTTTYRGVLPFLATDIVRLALLVLFPGIALFLVRLLA
jgi:tripartite ATP-independent transporter DctM subunit